MKLTQSYPASRASFYLLSDERRKGDSAVTVYFHCCVVVNTVNPVGRASFYLLSGEKTKGDSAEIVYFYCSVAVRSQPPSTFSAAREGKEKPCRMGCEHVWQLLRNQLVPILYAILLHNAGSILVIGDIY